MTTNKLISIFLIYILSQFVCLSFDGQIWGSTATDGGPIVTLFNVLTDFQIVDTGSIWTNMITLGKGLWSAFAKLFLWDYNFLTGAWFVVRVIFVGFSAACIISLAQTVFHKS